LGISFSYAFIVIAVIVVIVLAKTATVVPQQSAYVIENLGKYSRTLQAGFHILIPFVERVAYRHSLKEIAIDIAEQICITRDNVQVGVDAVLYMQVLDPHLASYGITNFGFAISQLAQTTLRSEIGKMRSKCARSAKSAPWCSPPRANATPRSMPRRATSNA
jgi:regulator of protease activity HflC (stomatin/prohibitin superfamily)